MDSPTAVPSTELLDYSSAFRALAQMTDLGVLIVTPDRRLDFLNERARQLLHCRAEDDRSACWARVQSAIAPVLDRADTERARPTRQAVCLSDRSSPRQLRVEVYPLISGEACADGGYLLLIKDSTALQQVEQSLHLALQMHQTGRLYEGLAHDLRQPIGAILIHLKVLEELNGRLDHTSTALADCRESIAIIRDEVRELDHSLRLLLRELSPSDTEEPIDLHDVMQSVTRLITPQVQKEGLTLRTEFADDALVVFGRRFRIKQAVLNLVTNAIEAMQRGTLTLRLYARSDQACIEVTDDGPGIPDDVQARMFERHYTTKTDGTGIGLHIVRQTAELHGGQVNVQSTLGEGTTFELLLPLYAAETVDDA